MMGARGPRERSLPNTKTDLHGVPNCLPIEWRLPDWEKGHGNGDAILETG
jgi:hypothetical protein